MTVRTNGFTLIELLVVVTILGIIAGIVIPMFNAQIDDVKQSSLETSTEVIRKAIEIFYQDHRGVFPGYPNGDTGQSPSEEEFLNQMFQKTTRDCRVDSDGPCGPYLRMDHGFPRNPLNERTRVSVATEHGRIPTLEESFGWVYSTSTGLFQPVTESREQSGVEEEEEEEEEEG